MVFCMQAHVDLPLLSVECIGNGPFFWVSTVMMRMLACFFLPERLNETMSRCTHAHVGRKMAMKSMLGAGGGGEGLQVRMLRRAARLMSQG
jgi:hypothetical protein